MTHALPAKMTTRLSVAALAEFIPDYLKQRSEIWKTLVEGDDGSDIAVVRDTASVEESVAVAAASGLDLLCISKSGLESLKNRRVPIAHWKEVCNFIAWLHAGSEDSMAEAWETRMKETGRWQTEWKEWIWNLAEPQAFGEKWADLLEATGVALLGSDWRLHMPDVMNWETACQGVEDLKMVLASGLVRFLDIQSVAQELQSEMVAWHRDELLGVAAVGGRRMLCAVAQRIVPSASAGPVVSVCQLLEQINGPLLPQRLLESAVKANDYEMFAECAAKLRVAWTSELCQTLVLPSEEDVWRMIGLNVCSGCFRDAHSTEILEELAWIARLTGPTDTRSAWACRVAKAAMKSGRPCHSVSLWGLAKQRLGFVEERMLHEDVEELVELVFDSEWSLELMQRLPTTTLSSNAVLRNVLGKGNGRLFHEWVDRVGNEGWDRETQVLSWCCKSLARLDRSVPEWLEHFAAFVAKVDQVMNLGEQRLDMQDVSALVETGDPDVCRWVVERAGGFSHLMMRWMVETVDTKKGLRVLRSLGRGWHGPPLWVIAAQCGRTEVMNVCRAAMQETGRWEEFVQGGGAIDAIVRGNCDPEWVDQVADACMAVEVSALVNVIAFADCMPMLAEMVVRGKVQINMDVLETLTMHGAGESVEQATMLWSALGDDEEEEEGGPPRRRQRRH